MTSNMYRVGGKPFTYIFNEPIIPIIYAIWEVSIFVSFRPLLKLNQLDRLMFIEPKLMLWISINKLKV